MGADNIINVVGAGLSGLSAARSLAQMGICVRLVSAQASERAQSNLAEGGINAVLDVMGENDTVNEHFKDTMKGGVYLERPDMVWNLVNAAPDVVRMMDNLGVPFHRENGHIVQRNFGGQRNKRTAYAKASTGKALTQALIDEVRKYEAKGLVERLSHHCFIKLIIAGGKCQGIEVQDLFTGKNNVLYGKVIIATGGLNGMFPGLTTGTTANTGSAAARLFFQGVKFANLEFIQYHPTTAPITGKRLLISEAARGEGGRLFTYNDDGSRYFFMEDKYGEDGNLKPRDIVSKEMAMLGRDVYLDLTGLSESTWDKKLSDLRDEIIHFLGIEPKTEPVPVSYGIHYFMGGIMVDERHGTNIQGLYAAGECACAYHGANRLGGNSLLGAIFGGITAANTAAEEKFFTEEASLNEKPEDSLFFMRDDERPVNDKLTQILSEGMVIIRNESIIKESLDKIRRLREADNIASAELRSRILLGEAMLSSALLRRESRGAHVRSDYPDTLEEYKKTTTAYYDNSGIHIVFEDIHYTQADCR